MFPFAAEEKLPTRIIAKVSGFECFLYNRTAAYDAIIERAREQEEEEAERAGRKQKKGQERRNGVEGQDGGPLLSSTSTSSSASTGSLGPSGKSRKRAGWGKISNRGGDSRTSAGELDLSLDRLRLGCALGNKRPVTWIGTNLSDSIYYHTDLSTFTATTAAHDIATTHARTSTSSTSAPTKPMLSSSASSPSSPRAPSDQPMSSEAAVAKATTDWFREALPLDLQIFTGSVVLGNDSTPSLAILAFESAKGTYSAERVCSPFLSLSTRRESV